MSEDIKNGSRKTINGLTQVYYEGYWIKCYEPPADSLSAKKQLIESLTRRLFNHMEHGINIPGRMLEQIRTAYETETDPGKKRVKCAMLAGALFNRAADIFSHLVELEASGVEISLDNDLMKTCGRCLQEALDYGKLVKHRNGDEGIDELWGEPFKAFVMSVEDFYETRYIKIAMTMKNIDQMATYMAACVQSDPRFVGLSELILNYAIVARRKCEVLRTDDKIFDVWSDYVVAGEKITDFSPILDINVSQKPLKHLLDVKYMLSSGVRLIDYITRARTPMPKSTQKFLDECEQYKARNS